MAMDLARIGYAPITAELHHPEIGGRDSGAGHLEVTE
jgi:hypothetical protein